MALFLTPAVLLRLLAALLAVAAFAVTGLRLYALSRMTVPADESLIQSLRILFPASLGALCAYLAIKGRMPFSQNDDSHSNESR